MYNVFYIYILGTSTSIKIYITHTGMLGHCNGTAHTFNSGI